MAKQFALGRIVATARVWELIDSNDAFSMFATLCFSRYLQNDWGELEPEDWRMNDLAVENGDDRILASYQFPSEIKVEGEEKLWIITEWDRSVTTLLFPGDY